MATRYGRRTGDGTYEYYDSKSELEAAKQEEGNDSIRGWFALGGLVLAGYGTYVLIQHYAAGLPKAVRFAVVIIGALGGSVLSAWAAVAIMRIVLVIFVLALLGGIAQWIWKAV